MNSTRQANQPHAPPAGESAGHPFNRVFERYRDETAAVTYNRQLWNELLSLRFLDGPHGALILGRVGKTCLASALGHIAIRRRRTVLMASAAKLFKRLRAARLDYTLDTEMRGITGIELLILDDFALRSLDPTQTADFYRLCVERHRKAATIITSDRTAEDWLAMMADPLLAAQSAVDRLASTARELIIEGQSYRHRQKPVLSNQTACPLTTRKETTMITHDPRGPILVATRWSHHAGKRQNEDSPCSAFDGVDYRRSSPTGA